MNSHSVVAEEMPAAPAEPAREPEPEAVEDTEIAEDADSIIAEMYLEELADTEENAVYAAPVTEADDLDDPQADAQSEDGEREKPARSARERFLSPLVAVAALIAIRKAQNRNADRQRPTEEDADADVPEMEPEKAVKFYGAQMGSLRFRGRVAALLSIFMLYLSFAWYSSALPLTGLLRSDIRALSLVLLIFELSVVITGLDTFTNGLLCIVKRHMNAETLVAVSCLFSMLDAAVTAAFGLDGYGLPFCAVSAISMTFAIWGSYYSCKGYRTSFRVLTMKKELYTVSGENCVSDDEVALMKSRRSAYGFVRRSEEADLGEYGYGTLTPFLLIAALILGLLASIGNGQPKAALHCISVLLASCTTFSCAICFSVPFSIAAQKLYSSGAAIAGWSGVRDISCSRHVVITDNDLFPKGTAEISNIRILEGSFTDKVISYAASVIAASGSGLSAAFAELVRRNGYTICKVEDFRPHDGGGMTAMVNGENVCIGSTGFMHLMGIRVPQKLSTASSLYVAVNNSLVGIFQIDYRSVSSVQDALVMLLRSNLEPVFAIRDFNITPMMIKTKFKMPTDSFKFPAYAERYRISGAEPDRHSRVAAVIAREGMGPLVDVAERGRRLHLGVQAATIISLAGSVFGLVMMFLLCWLGAFDSATVGNVITFMLLWLIPIAVIVAGTHR